MLCRASVEFPVKHIAQRCHDGIILTLILEEGSKCLVIFYIAGLCGIAEGLGPDTLVEHLWVRGLRHTAQFFIAGKSFVERVEDHPVALVEFTIKELIDTLNDFLQWLFYFRASSSLAFCRNDFYHIVGQRDLAFEGFLQFVEFELQSTFQIKILLGLTRE